MQIPLGEFRSVSLFVEICVATIGVCIFRALSYWGCTFFICKEIGMGDFIGTKAMAEIWDCKPSQITQWCRDGKIPGAEQDRKGSPWRIPVDALKPEKKKGV